MLSIDFIRDNSEAVKTGVKNKNLNPDVVDNLLRIDELRRELIQQVETLRAERNRLNESLKKERTNELLAEAMAKKQALKDSEPQLKKIEDDFANLMLQVPNIPLAEIPVGKDESGNETVKEWGGKTKFDFEPKDHIELGTDLGLLELERGVKVAGFRGYFLTGDGVLLQMAVMQYALKKLSQKGYKTVIPPIIDRRAAFVNSGHFPWGESEAYKLAEDDSDPENDYFLAGTAEVPLVSMYANENINKKDLPIRMAGFSPCYRREIGSYGKDTRGVYRVHEFMKIEQIIFCENDLGKSKEMHQELLENTEEMHQELGIPYRVLLMCTGDMGEPQAKKYDIESWMPGRNDYGETASNSIMTDFQSRRANIRYQDGDEYKYVHTLNNTALASPRILIAIIENHQQADGSIKIPAPLVPYVGKEFLGKKD